VSRVCIVFRASLALWKGEARKMSNQREYLLAYQTGNWKVYCETHHCADILVWDGVYEVDVIDHDEIALAGHAKYGCLDDVLTGWLIPQGKVTLEIEDE